MEPTPIPNPEDYFTPYPVPATDTIYRHIYFTVYQPMILSGMPIDEEMMGQFDGLDLTYPLTEQELYEVGEYNNYAARVELTTPRFMNAETGEIYYKKEDFLVTKSL